MNMKLSFSLFAFLLSATVTASAAELKEARVTQIIHDVKLLGGRTSARPAAVNDAVRQGDAVRTGQDSRAELTFVDLTITRLGANTVFSFNEAKREVNLDSGALLLEVPRDGASARINTAAATAAISGGTAMCESNKGFPFKLLVLEGQGHVCSTAEPEDCAEVGAGEMITTDADGKLSKPSKFNVGVVYQTAKLLTDFPPLPNADLIQLVIDESPLPNSSPDPFNNDDVDQANAGTPKSNPPTGGSPGKYGPPSTIASPNPYVINSSTQIQTDPTITTNGQTDLGKIYRSQAQDGPVPNFLYGSANTFDAKVFGPPGNEGPYAVFKFAGLQLAGDPTISTIGGATNLALVSVGDITSASPGGTLSFAGIDRLFIGTQNGSIDLGPEIQFDGPSRLTIYARGAGSTLTMGSAASADNHIHLFAGGDINVENELSTSGFRAVTGNDFFIGKGTIFAFDIDISAGHDISIYTYSIPDLDKGGGSIELNAGNTLDLRGVGGGTFNRDSLAAQGMTINLHPAGEGSTFDFSNSSFVRFIAGTGGINASGIEFYGHNLTLQSDGDISINSAITPLEGGKEPFLDGSITAAGTITANGSIFTGTLSSGGSISAGGEIDALDISAGDVGVGRHNRPNAVVPDANISADQGIRAMGGSITATGNITSMSGSIALDQDGEGNFGNITAGGNIFAAGGIFTPSDPAVVFAGGTITASGVITGTLHGATGITIDNTEGSFDFGIIANNVITDGTLQMINSSLITPNSRSASGGVGFTPVDFLLQAGLISSSGDTIPILRANGDNASDDPDIGNPGNGGNVTVDITKGGLTIGEKSSFHGSVPNGASFDLVAIEANGGDLDAGSTLGGDGGKIHITATGDVNLTDSGYISATTGRIPDGGLDFAGAGGEVTIDTPGAITVSSSIEVSSAEPTSTIAPTRRSASGGNITLTSSKATGAAISVGSSGQLLALLDNAAPGPGGKITILATGAGSSVNIDNQVEADRGTVDIRQMGSDGTINLATSGKDTLNIRGDIVKIGALGMNGVLNVGYGTISADTILKLYAGGSNGTINFRYNVTLDGDSSKIIAANTVNIFDGITVFIGGKNKADVYTQNPNYSMASGGNGIHTGTFGGVGANAPITAGTPPPFDQASRPPRSH